MPAPRSSFLAVLTIACLGVSSLVTTARADDAAKPDALKASPENQPAKPAVAAAPSAVEIQQWIKDLDSDLYATRQAAAQMLYETGKAAIPSLAESASGKTLEVTMQSVNVLRRLLQSSDTGTHDSAKDALERVAKGDNAAANAAREALKPAPQPQPAFAPNNIRGNLRIMPGGNLQLLPAGGMQVIRVQANANGNGKSTTEVQENGKKVHIEQDQNGIELKVTENVNGVDKTDTFKAKDADDLKKQSAEAFKLYQKYGQNANGFGAVQIQIQGGQIQLGGGAQAIPGLQLNPQFIPAIPLVPAKPAPTPAEARKQAALQVGEVRKQIAETIDNLKKNGGNGGDAEALKANVQQLEEAVRRLEETQAKLNAGG